MTSYLANSNGGSMKVVQTKHLHVLAPAEKLPKNDNTYIYI